MRKPCLKAHSEAPNPLCCDWICNEVFTEFVRSNSVFRTKKDLLLFRRLLVDVNIAKALIVWLFKAWGSLKTWSSQLWAWFKNTSWIWPALDPDCFPINNKLPFYLGFSLIVNFLVLVLVSVTCLTVVPKLSLLILLSPLSASTPSDCACAK